MTQLKQALKINTIATWILAGISIASFILYMIFQVLILAFVFLFFFIAIFMNIYDRKRIRRSHCPHCEEKYDYDEDVSWELTNVTTYNSKQKADVEIQCTCGNCGKTTNFTQNFVTAELDTFGNVKEHNLYNVIRKYFKI